MAECKNCGDALKYFDFAGGFYLHLITSKNGKYSGDTKCKCGCENPQPKGGEEQMNKYIPFEMPKDREIRLRLNKPRKESERGNDI